MCILFYRLCFVLIVAVCQLYIKDFLIFLSYLMIAFCMINRVSNKSPAVYILFMLINLIHIIFCRIFVSVVTNK